MARVVPNSDVVKPDRGCSGEGMAEAWIRSGTTSEAWTGTGTAEGSKGRLGTSQVPEHSPWALTVDLPARMLQIADQVHRVTSQSWFHWSACSEQRGGARRVLVPRSWLRIERELSWLGKRESLTS